MARFYVVYLECTKYIVVPENWLSKPTLGMESLVFYSPDSNKTPDFSLPNIHFLNEQDSGCYRGYVYKSFGKYK